MRPSSALRFWRTIRHLKPRQLLARLKPAPAAAVDRTPAPPLRALLGRWQKGTSRRRSMTGERSFDFLNHPGSISESWEPEGQEKLWLYNLHYFDDLNAEGAEQRVDWHRRLIADWFGRVPAGSGTGWEPYPLSLRVVNWIKWSLAGNRLSPEAIHSLAMQARWLSRRIEWHILGNHLFSNAKALTFAGLFFSGEEAEAWLRTGTRILRDELDEQILADGGHFERSPMYHSIALDDVLDLVNLLRCAKTDDRGLLARLEAKVPPMLRWLRAMAHPDGEIAFFNDAAIGIAPSPEELERYALSLGFDAPPPGTGRSAMPQSGFVRLSGPDAVVIADVGPVGPDYLPGHAHADTLSFEMSLGGRRLIVNSGTSVYGSGEERLRQRGTAAHSTLVVDGRDSSEVWSGFRVGRRAMPFAVRTQSDETGELLEASHDGYRWLRGRPVHRRCWRLGESSLTIKDAVTGKGRHSAAIYLHLPPWIAAEPLDDCSLRLIDKDEGRALAEVRSESGLPVAVQSSSWHPEFGQSLPSNRLRVEQKGLLPLTHAMTIRWNLQ